MVYQKVIWQIYVGTAILYYKLRPDKLVQAILEIAKKYLAALAREQTKDIIIVLLQMLKEMAEDRFRHSVIRVYPMRMCTVLCAGNNMTK